jgi:hypothetical protein
LVNSTLVSPEKSCAPQPLLDRFFLRVTKKAHPRIYTA